MSKQRTTSSTALLVTVFSDASVKNGKAGFGWWFKSAEKSGSGYGRDDRDFGPYINHAELVGILIAVREAVRAHGDREIVLLIQCDNINALAALVPLGAVFAKNSPLKAPSRVPKRQEEALDVVKLAEIVGSRVIYLKHVKGHRGNRCNRSSVNSITDTLARRGRLSHEN